MTGPISLTTSALVTEVPVTGEDHRDARSVRGGDHFGIFHAAAGLRDSGDAGLGGGFDAVGEWEEGVGGEHAALRSLTCFLTCNLHRNHARHLAGADADGDVTGRRARRSGEDDGVRFDVLAHAPSELE